MLAGLLLMCPVPLLGQPQSPPASNQPELPQIRSVRIEGVSVYTANEMQQRLGLVPGARLPNRPEDIARDILVDIIDYFLACGRKEKSHRNQFRIVKVVEIGVCSQRFAEHIPNRPGQF